MIISQGLAILEMLAAAERELTTAEIQEATGLPPATLTRLLNNLRGLGYILKEGRGRYSIGGRMLAMSAAVLGHSYRVRFLPFMRELAELTGLNAELYMLAQQGPQLVIWEKGRSEFSPRMSPGHRIAHDNHPVVHFYRLLTGRTELWGGLGLAGNLTEEERAEFARAAREDNFIIERGHVRPEMARACMAAPGGVYVFGVSGLISEYRLGDGELREIMARKLAEFGARFSYEGKK